MKRVCSTHLNGRQNAVRTLVLLLTGPQFGNDALISVNTVALRLARLVPGWVTVLAGKLQGSHTSLKVLDFFPSILKALKVLENRVGA